MPWAVKFSERRLDDVDSFLFHPIREVTRRFSVDLLVEDAIKSFTMGYGWNFVWYSNVIEVFTNRNLDTDVVHFEIFREIMQPFGHIVDHKFYKDRISGKHNSDIFRELLPSHYTDKEIDDFASNKEAMYISYWFNFNCLDFVITLQIKIHYNHCLVVS